MRIGCDGFAIVGDCISIAIMQLKLTSHARICLAVAGIDGADLCKPCIGRPINEQLEGAVDSHCIERIGSESECLVGLGGSRFAIVVFER
jgi:hypothetical protein